MFSVKKYRYYTLLKFMVKSLIFPNRTPKKRGIPLHSSAVEVKQNVAFY